MKETKDFIVFDENGEIELPNDVQTTESKPLAPTEPLVFELPLDIEQQDVTEQPLNDEVRDDLKQPTNIETQEFSGLPINAETQKISENPMDIETPLVSELPIDAKARKICEEPLVIELPMISEQDMADKEPENSGISVHSFDVKKPEDIENPNISENTKNLKAPTAKKTHKGSSPYVSKKLLLICLAISIVVSSALGAVIGSLFQNVKISNSNLSESSLSKATGSKLTVSQIVAKNADAVVEIVVEATQMGFFGETQIVEGAGSGVIVNADGYIVTNYHVIEGAKSVQVTLHNGNSYKAKIVGGDNSSDIAVLKINAKKLSSATIGNSSNVAVGDLAVAIGNPLGQLGGTATTGIVSALDRSLTIDGRTLNLMQTDAAINPGNSGGGLFNGAGELIGIVDAKTAATDVEGLAFALPINDVKHIINSLITDGKVPQKPTIGISIYDVSEENSQNYDLDGEGVYIAEVYGNNANKAGLKEGDKIEKYNGSLIENSEDLIKKVREGKIGDKVTLIIIRDGQKMEIKTTLEGSTDQ